MLRPYLITIPLSALCFLGFHLHGLWIRITGRAPGGMPSVGRIWSRCLLRSAGITVDVSGGEELSKLGPCVLVSNHLSFADTPLLLGWIPVDFRILAKDSLFRLPIVGSHLRAGGHVPVQREDARSAAQSLAQAADILRDSRTSVLIFAEGTRSTGDTRSFKSGAAHLAIQAGVPLVPVAVLGTPQVLPRNSITLRPGRLRLAIGEPIATTGLTRRDRDRVTADLESAVARLIGAPPLQMPSR